MLCRASGWSATVWAALWLSAGCRFSDPRAHDERACQHYARETCARLSACSPWVIEQTYQPARGCREALTGPCVDSLAEPDVLSNADGVFACGDTMEHVTCSQLVNNELPSSCRAPRGRRGDGVACEVDAQCASARCVQHPHTGRGTCREQVQSGGSCANPSDCRPPLVCAPNRRCTALGGRSVACSTNRPCRYPLACLDDDCAPSATGACRGDECDPRSPERIGTACTAYASALCAQLASCSPALLTSVYGELDVCGERTQGACERSASAAHAVGTGAGIALCAAALDTISCEDLLNNSLPEACRPLPGQLDDTSACAEHAECASLRCARADDTLCGRCAELANEGERCATASDCAVGLVCTTAALCALPLAERGRCASDRPCAFPLVCAAGACSTTLASGSPCDPKADRCNTFAGQVCGPLSLVCEPLRYERAGGPCGWVDGGWTACSQGATCVESGATSHCVAAAAVGAACSFARSWLSAPRALRRQRLYGGQRIGVHVMRSPIRATRLLAAGMPAEVASSAHLCYLYAP